MGVVIWDVTDHNASRRKNEPILRNNLNDYLVELQHMLLNDAETGMLAVVRDLESKLFGAHAQSRDAERQQRGGTHTQIEMQLPFISAVRAVLSQSEDAQALLSR